MRKTRRKTRKHYTHINIIINYTGHRDTIITTCVSPPLSTRGRTRQVCKVNNFNIYEVNVILYYYGCSLLNPYKLVGY
jgi:hypothetical protein